MKPADDPGRDYRRLVVRGYDTCAAAYNDARKSEAADVLAPLIERLPAGARVLDLGCGAGVPVASTLAARFDVTGVDISPAQIALARAQVPGATFIRADMAARDFAPASVDAVVSFYAIFHLPREEHAPLFRRIHRWLKPGGYLLATLALHDEPGYTEDGFFGVEMFWSNYSIDAYRRLLVECGFHIIDDATLSHGYEDGEHAPEAHPLVLAQRT